MRIEKGVGELIIMQASHSFIVFHGISNIALASSWRTIEKENEKKEIFVLKLKLSS
jgi:hypothetical protein